LFYWKPMSKKTILVVDDTPVNVEILTGILGGTYNIKYATNGICALKSAQRNPPHLILLDIMMPEMDGYEACRRFKENPDTSEIPIIFITAKTERKDIVKGFEIGGQDYVTKPFNPQELCARIQTHLNLQDKNQELHQAITTQNELNQRLIESGMQLLMLAKKLSKYLSPQVYSSIFEDETQVELGATNKPISVMFSDIVGFTSISEEMTPGDLAAWLNDYLNAMAAITIKWQGTLDKYIGDAVMVFFGDPKTLGPKQDALNCIQMAIEMSVKAANMGVQVRFGINSGDCTVGNFGSVERMDYTIIGPNVNLSARLEQVGEPGKILISEHTYSLIKDKYECTPRSPIFVKGIERELMTYWVNLCPKLTCQTNYKARGKGHKRSCED
jgi:adenylate cyclase